MNYLECKQEKHEMICAGAIGEEGFGSLVLEEDFHLDVALDHWANNFTITVIARDISCNEDVCQVGDQASSLVTEEDFVVMNLHLDMTDKELLRGSKFYDLG
ncbi:hypothetical protein CAPTEDRAFT_199983 [Capitella teleta]|uniref:Uncharacterized protein n=1 Tax=Capitella teleta TaxID=283909 RepID=R7T465_CAPTE|nr:hypothetical protein CAPTEDRAFT_199983 [Capitella teleta]|eukprot:ELT87702.1 hypothetical protein CAPTEDRAFT_199983 [Capitella teleta]